MKSYGTVINDAANSTKKPKLEYFIHILFVVTSILIILSGIFLIKLLTIVDVLIGIDLIFLGIFITFLEILQPSPIIKNMIFWQHNLSARGLVLTFLGLVACNGSVICGFLIFIIAFFVISIHLFLEIQAPPPVFCEWVPVGQEEFQTRAPLKVSHYIDPLTSTFMSTTPGQTPPGNKEILNLI